MGMRAEGEVGVQRDTQDFTSSVQQSHHITDSNLGVESALVGVRGEQGHAAFLGSNGQLLAICPPREQSWFALASASTMLGTEASNMKSLALDVMSASGIGQPETNGWSRQGRWRTPVGLPPAPGGKESGAVGKSTMSSCRRGTPRAI